MCHRLLAGLTKSSVTDALFFDDRQLIVFCCTPVFTVVVDRGVNDSALIESKAVALGAVHLPLVCGELRGKDNCFISKSAQSDVRAPRAGEHRQTSQSSWPPEMLFHPPPPL